MLKYESIAELVEEAEIRGCRISEMVLADQAEAYEFVALAGGNYLNVPLIQLGRKKGVLVSMIVRGRQIIIPFGSDHIEAGDTVILVALAGTVNELKDAFAGTER